MTDNLVEMAKSLEGIARDVREEAKTLNTEVINCECCDRQTWIDRDEYELARELEALAAKADRLYGKVHGIVNKRGAT